MGIDWNSMFGDAQAAVNQGLADLQKTAVPALEATLETQAISVLQKQKDTSTASLQAGIKEIQSRPAQAGSFGAMFQSTLTNAGLKNYGPMILVGVLALVVVGYMLSEG